MFETSFPVINGTVEYAEISSTLGYKVLSHLRINNLDPKKYKQLFIKMKSSSEVKIELICAFKDIHLTI